MRLVVLRPCPPYSLARTVRGPAEPTLRARDGIVHVAVGTGADARVATVRQRPDGAIEAVFPTDATDAHVASLRFRINLDDDIAPFLAVAADDPLLAAGLERLRGWRPLRTASVAHALVRGLAGQLITGREARSIEARILARFAPALDHGLRAAPERSVLQALTPAQLEACGLSGRRATALVGTLRRLDVERLHAHPTAAVLARLQREPMIGPWTCGVVCIEGLGRYDHGLVGDLGLVHLARALSGDPDVDGAAATAALLAPYAQWAGLASRYLLAHPLAGRHAWRGAVASRRPPRLATRPAG